MGAPTVDIRETCSSGFLLVYHIWAPMLLKTGLPSSPALDSYLNLRGAPESN